MTIQLKDSITIDGEEFLLRVSDQLPVNSNSFVKNAGGVDEIYFSSMCHKRYRADWLVDGDFLYLHKVHGLYSMASPEPIKANWVFGEIETTCGLVMFVRYGRVVNRYVRPFEDVEEEYLLAGHRYNLNQLAQSFGLIERIKLSYRFVKDNKPNLAAITKNLKAKRRIALLRYRLALLDVRLATYVVGCSRYRFAEKRANNTKRLIAALSDSIKLS